MIALKYSTCYKLTVEYKWKPNDDKKVHRKINEALARSVKEVYNKAIRWYCSQIPSILSLKI